MSRRMTWKKEDGTWGLEGMDFEWSKLSPSLYGALCKLKDYEEICDSPSKLREIDNLYLDKCEEVVMLEQEIITLRAIIKDAGDKLLNMAAELMEVENGARTKA